MVVKVVAIEWQCRAVIAAQPEQQRQIESASETVSIDDYINNIAILLQTITTYNLTFHAQRYTQNNTDR